MSEDRKDYGAIKLALKTGRKNFINNICKRRNVNALSPTGVPILIWAVKENDLSGVKILLRRGADINTKDPDGRTPLIHAVMLEGFGMTLLLCDRKYRHELNINETDNDGWTAMNFALINGNTEAVTILEHRGGRKGYL